MARVRRGVISCTSSLANRRIPETCAPRTPPARPTDASLPCTCRPRTWTPTSRPAPRWSQGRKVSGQRGVLFRDAPGREREERPLRGAPWNTRRIRKRRRPFRSGRCPTRDICPRLDGIAPCGTDGRAHVKPISRHAPATLGAHRNASATSCGVSEDQKAGQSRGMTWARPVVWTVGLPKQSTHRCPVTVSSHASVRFPHALHRTSAVISPSPGHASSKSSACRTRCNQGDGAPQASRTAPMASRCDAADCTRRL